MGRSCTWRLPPVSISPQIPIQTSVARPWIGGSISAPPEMARAKPITPHHRSLVCSGGTEHPSGCACAFCRHVRGAHTRITGYMRPLVLKTAARHPYSLIHTRVLAARVADTAAGVPEGGRLFNVHQELIDLYKVSSPPSAVTAETADQTSTSPARGAPSRGPGYGCPETPAVALRQFQLVADNCYTPVRENLPPFVADAPPPARPSTRRDGQNETISIAYTNRRSIRQASGSRGRQP